MTSAYELLFSKPQAEAHLEVLSVDTKFRSQGNKFCITFTSIFKPQSADHLISTDHPRFSIPSR
jgi:hypothetical protein